MHLHHARAEQAHESTRADRTPEGLSRSDWQRILGAREEGRHAFTRADDGRVVVENPGQQLEAVMDARGFTATAPGADWRWGLELTGFGWAGRERPPGQSHGSMAGRRFTRIWDDGLEEWYVNRGSGLEHGFTVPTRPDGPPGTALSFVLAVRGGLRPEVEPDGLAARFVRPDGAAVLTYSGLKVWDADGDVLTARMNAAGDGALRIEVEETGARYPLTVDPVVQQAFLKPAAMGSTQTGDNFGASVAVSGNTVVVGAPGEDSSTSGINSTANENASFAGAAYVFVRNGSTWTQQAYLKASNPGADDRFGTSVAISGNTIIVGAPEEDSSTTGINSSPNESAALAGAAYVFTRNGSTWIQQAYLKAGNTGAGDQFGAAVAISGTTAVVGAWREDSSTTGINSASNNNASDSGAAYVFTRSGSNWSQQAYIKAGNTGANDTFGRAVAVSGDTIVVGAQLEDSSNTGVNGTPNEGAADSGAAYIFARSGTVWAQQAYVKPINTGASDNFGASVAVAGNTAVVGAPNEDSSTTGVNSTPDNAGNNTGAAYVFTRSGAVWTHQAYLKSGNSGNFDLFGISVGASGETAVVGARGESSSTTGIDSMPNDGAPNAGAAYLFTRRGTVWSQLSYLKAGHTTAGDFFGGAVAIAGDLVVAGAIGEDSSSTGINAGPNEGSADSGAAFVFTLPNPVLEYPAGSVLSEVDGTADLGTVATGASGTPQTFTVRNLGATNLTGLTLAAEGVNAADFVVSAPTSTTVPGDGTVTFTVTFAPKVPDFRTAMLSVRVNGEPLPRTSVRLVGYGLGPELISAVQRAYLKPAAVGVDQESDQFGRSVAVSGNTVVVGARFEDSDTAGVNSAPNEGAVAAGAAYVFVRNGTTWTQQAYLKASNPGAFDAFGNSVAISGDIIVVGAPREDSSTTGVNSTPNELASDAGAAYVFVRNGTTWTQQAYLKSYQALAGSDFGESVGVSGETVVVGSGFRGTADVFVRSGSIWSHQTFFASNPSHLFGYSVAISGDTVVVGAYQEDSSSTGVNSTANTNADEAGAAYVYFRTGKNWALQAYLKASNTGAGDRFGFSVSVSGDTVVVGAQNEDGSSPGINGISNEGRGNSGAAYVFTRNGTTWTQQAYVKPSNPTLNDWFGTSVGVSGDTMVVGGSGGPVGYVFTRNGTNWTQLQQLPTPPGAADFGFSSAVSGNTVVVGAYSESSGTTGINTIPDDTAPSSGAAYIFSQDTPQIAVEQPVGTGIGSGGSANLIAAAGSHADITFTVRNLSTVPLLLTGSPRVALSGPNAGLFSVTMQPASPVAPGSTTPFVVRFAPTTGGARNATLTIGSNDPEQGIYTIQLLGTGLSPAVDTDGDGLNDAAEFQMAALGFEWQIAQPSLVEVLMANANTAGLFTPAQLQVLQTGPLLFPGADGTFRLTIGLERSNTLGTFSPFPFVPAQTTINNDGEIEFRFTLPDNAAFFRLDHQ